MAAESDAGRSCYACESAGIHTRLEHDAEYCTSCGTKLDPFLGPGSRIDQYEIRELVGEGGMGQVYRGVEPKTGQEVAIKRIQRELSDNPQIRNRFVEEARTMSALRHSSIVRLFKLITEGGRLFLVMDYVRGTTVGDQIAMRGPLAVEEAIGVTTVIARALDFMHTLHKKVEYQADDGSWHSREIHGMVHRDVKPSNMLVDDAGHPWLIDFGVARTEGRKAMTEPGKILGTYEYMSPEQVQGERVGPASDQYALAVSLYEMLTGQLPFPRSPSLESDSAFSIMDGHVNRPPPPLRPLRTDLPEAVEQVVMRGMSKATSERFPSCAAFADALQEAVPERSAGTIPGTNGGQGTQKLVPQRFPTRYKAGVAAAVLVAILALAAAFFAMNNKNAGTRKVEHLEIPKSGVADGTTTVCGDQECGEGCGACKPGWRCEQGHCVCQPQCANAQCGGNQCGGSCGECESGAICRNSRCVPIHTCRPDCSGKDCGPDGCGGVCGECGSGLKCSNARCVRVHVCRPDCDGRVCGDDGCGGSCGRCSRGTCVGGGCLAPAIVEGPKPILAYVARLSRTDHHNSKGVRLKDAAGVVRQERAYYHRFNRADAEDEFDSMFHEYDKREWLCETLDRTLDADTAKAIMDGTPLVRVTVWPDTARVEIVEY